MRPAGLDVDACNHILIQSAPPCKLSNARRCFKKVCVLLISYGKMRGSLRPQPRTGQGPRLSLRGQGPRRSLRHLRPAGQHRHGLRRRYRRHPGVRGRLHREVVAHRGLQALSRGRLPPDPRRQRRQQRLHAARLEIQPAASPLQSPRPARDGGPLPHGRVEVEPHRTPPALRNQQELGGTPAGQLRDHPEIPAHHTHGGRAARASASGQEGLQDRHQGRRRTNAGTPHHRGQRLAEVELHHRTHRTHVAKMGTYSCAGP